LINLQNIRCLTVCSTPFWCFRKTSEAVHRVTGLWGDAVLRRRVPQAVLLVLVGDQSSLSEGAEDPPRPGRPVGESDVRRGGVWEGSVCRCAEFTWYGSF